MPGQERGRENIKSTDEENHDIVVFELPVGSPNTREDFALSLKAQGGKSSRTLPISVDDPSVPVRKTMREPVSNRVRFSTGLGLFACILVLCASAATANQCTSGCHGIHSNKAYQEGQTYTYDLEGSSVTTISEAQGDSIIKLHGTVELSVKPDCVQQIKLKNVQVNGAPVALPDVEKYGLQFNYHNGHIDTEVCAEPGDSQASLNVKRAVVSLFQSALLQDEGSTTHHETDVFGGCPTDFSFQKEGDNLLVYKSRNLVHCSHRESIRHGLISANFDSTADVKSTPIMAAHQKIEQRYKRGVLNKAVSTETYNYRPFSNGDSSAKTVVETVLTLKGHKGGAGSSPVSEPKSLIFEAPHPVQKSSVEAINNALNAVKAQETPEAVKPEVALKFAELVKVLRSSSKKNIMSVYQKVKSGSASDKKILLDALFRTGSGEAAEVATQLIRNKEVTGMEALLYYYSLALIRHVNLPSVTAVASLLDQPDLPRIGYLGVGQVIGKYCQEHNCENVPEVKSAISKLRKIAEAKTNNRQEEDRVITALKALGNTRFLDDETIVKLTKIASDKSVMDRVRVAAIAALPTKCSPKWQEVLLNVLGDLEEDSEIRIKSYLALVACPNPQVANQLKEILDKETVNQVGSFITSHLRNLRATVDPAKQEAKRQFGQIMPRKKFPEDFRKFSFNNELSYNFDAFGIGSSIENSVIYSQNSFVPRSVSVNLTTEIFGRSFHFLELDGRVENLDRIIEHFFGPKGYFQTNEFKDLMSNGVRSYDDLSKHVKGKIQQLTRRRREVKQAELDKFAENVNLRGNEMDKELALDLSVKLFGVELAYLSYEGANYELSPDKIVDKIFDYLGKGFDKVKDFNYNLEKHLHFLDLDLVYPTSLGFPMALGVTGTSVVHVKTHGKIDLPTMLKDPKNSAFRVAVDPSAAVTVAGYLTVEGIGAEAGCKVIATLHTATGSDVSVKMLEGHGIDVNFGVPKRKQEIITVSSDILLGSGPKGDKYAPAKFDKGKEHSDCFEQFSGMLGVTVCGHLTLPYDSIESVQKKPFYPLSGPAKFGLTIENDDVTSYHFKTYYDTKNPKSRSLEILLETPNSKTNRRLSLMVEGAVEPDKMVRVAFDSPFKKASAQGTIKCNSKEHTVALEIHNDHNEYFARVGVVANGNKFKPVLDYKVPEHIERLAGKKTKGGEGQQYNVRGDVEVSDEGDGHKYVFHNVELVSSGRPMAGVDGSLTATSKSALLDVKVSYGVENLALKVQGKRLAEMQYTVEVSAVPSKDPNIGFLLKWDYTKTKGALDHQLVFTHGPDLNSKVNRLTVVHKENVDLDPQNMRVWGHYELTYPAAAGLSLLGEAELTRKSLGLKVKTKYDKFKLGSELKATIGANHPQDYEIEFEADVLENSIELELERKILGDHKSKFENSLELKPGGKYEANALVTYNVKPNDVNVQVDGELKLNDRKLKIDTGFEANPQKLNSRALVTLDGTKYIDFLLRGQRGSTPSGNLNLNLKNYLIATGQFNYKNGKGNADMTLEVPRIGRKVKGSADMTVSGSVHSGNLEILFDADKDPSKRLKVSTVTDMSKNALDTKNVIEVMSYKTEINANGKLQGQFNDGHLVGTADITLPNQRYIVFKVDRDLHAKDTSMKADVKAEIMDHPKKGAAPRKIVYMSQVVIPDTKRDEFQSQFDVKYETAEEKDVVLHLALKHDHPKDSDKRAGQVEAALSGSLVPVPMSVDMEAEYDQNSGKWNTKCMVGETFRVKGVGNYLRGNGVDSPCKIDADVEVKLPSEKLRNVRLQTAQNLLHSSDPTKRFDVSGTTTLTYNDDQTLKLEGKCNHNSATDGKSEGSATMTLTALKYSPLTLTSSYKHNPTGEMKKESGSVGIRYGDKDASLTADAEYDAQLTKFLVHAKGTTPLEKLKQLQLELSSMREADGTYRKNDVTLDVDNRRYTLSSELNVAPLSPQLHVFVTSPEGKIELLAKFQKLGDHEYTGEYKFMCPKGFVKADGHVNLESVDNFNINLNFDSDKVKLRKIHAQLTNNPTAKTGRKIVVTVTSEGKNIVTGSTNYKKSDEGGKVVVEGNGNLKIGENTRTSSFKYTRKQLTRDKDNEVGVAILLNTNFGPSAIVGELKLTNKELNVFNSYCEQSKDCAHFKLQAKSDFQSKLSFNHQLTVEVDLKKFNVPVEFGLKTNTQAKENGLDQTASLYLHSSKEKNEYVYKFYIHPKESAVILSLPSREMAIISSFDVPKGKQSGGFKLDTSVYLDRKNKPTEKTSLALSGDVHLEKGSGSVNGEGRFTYPSQTKPLLVKGKLHYGGEHLLDANLDLDVFAKNSQKISVVAKLTKIALPRGYNVTGVLDFNSRGQQLKVDLQNHAVIAANELGFGSFLSYTDVHQKPRSVGVLFSLNPREGHFLVKGPHQDFVKVDGKNEYSKNYLKAQYETKVLELPARVVQLELKDLNSFSLLVYPKGAQNNKFVFNGKAVLGQLAEIDAAKFKDGTKMNLFQFLIHLDEGKFLKPEASYNKENIVNTMKAVREELIAESQNVKEVLKGVMNEVDTELKDLFTHLKKAQPNLKPLVDYYQGELNKLKVELHADQTIKDIQAKLNHLFGDLISTVVQSLKIITERLQEFHLRLMELYSKLEQAAKATYAKLHLKESFDKLYQIGVEILDALANVAVAYLQALLDVLNKHQEELKELATVVSELAHDIAKILYKGYSQIEKDVKEFVVLLIQQVRALPIYEVLKEKYKELQEFRIPESVLVPFEDLAVANAKLAPTKELKDLCEALNSYIFRHLKGQKVDDIVELKKIYHLAVQGLESLLTLLQSHDALDYVWSFWDTRLSPDLTLLKILPGFASFKSSLFNVLKNKELPSLSDIYHAYRPTYYMSDIVPPFSKSGIITDGGHFFTFDGRHLTIPGSCNYILAQDMEDGNFSVIANFNNGNFVSITVTEPNESVTLKSNGNILVNGKPSEFPAQTKNLQAFLTSPVANIKSKYGVHIHCAYKAPMICSVHVSGFYHGRTRGLLGDGNNEPYDDFTVPSGKIVQDDTEFGNSYKLNGNCPTVNAIDHKSAKRAPVCTEYFSGNSPMSHCFEYVNPAHYRDACDIAVNTGVQNGACLAAVAYYSACRSARVFIETPSVCGHCQVGNDKIAVGDSFSLKIPKKEADVIFVVEQDSKNEKLFSELVQPMITELKNELHHHGISDVHIGLIGYGEHMKWPQHYTTEGNLNVNGGEVKNMVFKDSTPLISYDDAKEGDASTRLKFLKQRLDVELGTFKLTDAYEEAIRYPYRPGAAKAVVAIIASPCEKSPIPISLQQLRLLLGKKLYNDLGLTYYHVTYMRDLTVSGKPQKNVVAFDSDSVYTFADAKKKPLEGNSDMMSNLLLSNPDVCAEFAVSSGGAAFSSNNFLDAKPNQKKQFTQVATRIIAEQLANTEIEQDCDCRQFYGLAARPHCKIVGRREKETLARHTKGATKA